MMEEAGIPVYAPLVPLDAVASVPASQFQERNLWEPNVYVVPERAFGVYLDEDQTITLSNEHIEYRWLPYEEAAQLLKWDSNKTALWELNERLTQSDALVPEERWPNGTYRHDFRDGRIAPRGMSQSVKRRSRLRHGLSPLGPQ